MFDSDRANDYAERADMHEQLAEATADDAARKMHRAMAEAYRRKAAAPLDDGADGMAGLLVADSAY